MSKHATGIDPNAVIMLVVLAAGTGFVVGFVVGISAMVIA